MSGLKVMIPQEKLKHSGTAYMTGGSQWMAIGCFVKMGREEEKESCSVLRRALNV